MLDHTRKEMRVEEKEKNPCNLTQLDGGRLRVFPFSVDVGQLS